MRRVWQRPEEAGSLLGASGPHWWLGNVLDGIAENACNRSFAQHGGKDALQGSRSWAVSSLKCNTGM